jgi:hypothetical protein
VDNGNTHDPTIGLRTWLGLGVLKNPTPTPYTDTYRYVSYQLNHRMPSKRERFVPQAGTDKLLVLSHHISEQTSLPRSKEHGLDSGGAATKKDPWALDKRLKSKSKKANTDFNLGGKGRFSFGSSMLRTASSQLRHHGYPSLKRSKKSKTGRG